MTGDRVTATRSGHRQLHVEWIGANAIAEAIGLGTTLVLGRALAARLADTSAVAELLLTAGIAIAAGIVLEGLVVGWAQGRVIHRYFGDVSVGAWVRATALGAGAAWLVGMFPSTVVGLIQLGRAPVDAAQPPPDASVGPVPLVQYALAAALGAVAGPVLGVFQSRVLRSSRPPVRGWVVANAAAWALGMVVLFIGMDVLPWAEGGAALAVGIYAVCGLAGALVGAVHGRWLVAAHSGESRHA
ncbi:MAG TPA: hypothetical protein VFU00_05750 [Gemmatimonadales bacterium]|nr:hypothetical protein [Gemmatimonadales bacterium]